MAESQVAGQVLFYQQVEPLTAEAHGQLGFKRVERPFQFMGASDAVPLTVNEFGMAASSFPIIFAGDDKTPLGLMGIRPDENLFVSPSGDMDPGIYLPAFARRYPFLFAHDPEGQNLILCIDRAAPMISANPDLPFFDGDKPSQIVLDAIEFLKEFERFRQDTDRFLAMMRELDLFERRSLVISKEQNAEMSFFAISEEKLEALPMAKMHELREQGMIAPIYAHLVSIMTWPRLIHRAVVQEAAKNGGKA
jgi:hypothetical protein